jgi:hypothetical protein
MKSRLLGCLAAAAICLASTASTYADVYGYENFDGGAVNLNGTSNVFPFNGGGGTVGDVFGTVSQFAGGSGTGGPFDVYDDSVADTSGGGAFPADALGIAGQNSTGFFAMNDSDGFTPSVNNAVWNFDISGATLGLTDISIDIAAMGDFEASSTDGFLIEAQIDGGGYQEIFKGRTDEALSHTYRPMDGGTAVLLNDPLVLSIDGVTTGIVLDKSDAATGAFDTYVSTLLAGATGSQLDVRISWAGTPSGGEPMGMDNITVNGIPEPASLSLLLVGAVAGLRRRR